MQRFLFLKIFVTVWIALICAGYVMITYGVNKWLFIPISGVVAWLAYTFFKRKR